MEYIKNHVMSMYHTLGWVQSQVHAKINDWPNGIELAQVHRSKFRMLVPLQLSPVAP